MMSQPDSRIFRVLPRQVDQTLAAAMRQWMPGKSWSEVQGLIRRRRAMVNGNLCTDAGRRLRLSDVVKLFDRSQAAPAGSGDVRIVYLDAHVVVVEKPAGVTTMRHDEERNWPARRRQIQPTLDEMIDQLLNRPAPKQRAAQKERSSGPRGRASVRAVHRLDRETSGLIVFARSPQAERHLARQFRQHTTHRRYLAVAAGDVSAQSFTARLIRDRGDGRRGSTTLPDSGKHAVTHVRPIERLGDYTLIECRLETGRTHQIRIHLAESGHLLCGENVYNRPFRKKPIADASGAPRLALHAAELGFDHPITGQPMRFETPLASDLAAFVERLRNKAQGAG
jgi:23S rRNA pseudouridine1911/1915/1917 synthase